MTAHEARERSTRAMYEYIDEAASKGRYHANIQFEISDVQKSALTVAGYRVSIHEDTTNGFTRKYTQISW
jgi:hypothetical protein